MKILLSEDVKPYVLLSFDENKKIAPKIEEEKLKREFIEKGYNEGFKKGYEEGYNEGLKKGYEEGFNKSLEDIQKKEKELLNTTQTFKELINELSLFKERQLELFLPQILKLSLTIAEKVVATKINLDKEVVLSIINETLKAVPIHEEKIILKVNPEDYNFLSDKIKEFKIDTTKLHIESSPDISKGGVWIETQSQHLVSTIEQRFKEIENALNSVLSQEG
ncbi:MAG: FliH/SctL family protein [Thermodesulfovibrio sp.]|nr:FliH/SctL family protein [Thermodesulfovibrio sp.]MDW7998751.1 FliH/SctL family protein [Thermodesulfovibrio sp.]